MHIAILIDLLVSGGVQKAAIEETKYLQRIGHKTQLFCLTRSQYEYQYHDLLKNIKIKYLSDSNPPPFKKAYKIPPFSFLTTNHLLNPLFVSRYQKIKDFDLIIAHGSTTCLTAYQISKKYNIPYLAYIWDPMEFILKKVYQETALNNFSKLLEALIFEIQKKIFQNAQTIITPSTVHQNFLKKKYKIAVTVIPPGHDLKASNIKRKPGYILGYSRWQPEKNPDFFIKLAKKINTPIVLAGLWTDKKAFSDFKIKVKKQNLNIKIIESVKHEDIPKLAQNAIAWVHPHFEAFGMPGLELASLGVPLIIPQGSGVTDIFQNKVHGFFPPQNQIKMIRAVKKLIQNPQLAAHMGQQAALVATQYTWENHTQKLITAINKKAHKTHLTILQNAFTSSSFLGGGDRFMLEIASRLTDCKITLITPRLGFKHWQKIPHKKHINFQLLSPNFFDNKLSSISIFATYLIRTLQTTKILLQKNHPSVISATELTPDIIPAFIYKKIHPQTIWISRIFHLIPPPSQRTGNLLVNTISWLLQRFSLILMRSCDKVLVDNHILATQLQTLNIKKQKIQIHPGGVNFKLIRNYKPKTKQKYEAAFVGRFSAHKGIYDLVPIWKKVVKQIPQSKLAIIGTGPQSETRRLKNQIKQNNLEKSIKLLGFLKHKSKNNMPIFDVLKNTKLLLFTDHEAGFGLIIVEAMATGLPVIAYNLPVFGSIYNQGFKTSTLKDINSFSQNIVKLLQNKTAYNKLKREAINQAKQFDWDLAANQFSLMLDIYKRK